MAKDDRIAASGMRASATGHHGTRWRLAHSGVSGAASRAAGQITDAPFNGYTGYQQPDVGATEFFAPRNGAPAMV
jgi:hypothetical protein